MSGNRKGRQTGFDVLAPVRSPSPVFQNIPTTIELNQLRAGRKDNGSQTPEAGIQTDWSLPQTPADIESRPGTPPRNETLVVHSLTNPPMNKWRFLNAALISLSQGMNGM